MNQTIFLEMNTLPPGIQYTNSILTYQSCTMRFLHTAIRSQEVIRHAVAYVLSLFKKVVRAIIRCTAKVFSTIKSQIIMKWAPPTGPPDSRRL